MPVSETLKSRQKEDDLHQVSLEPNFDNVSLLVGDLIEATSLALARNVQCSARLHDELWNMTTAA